MKLSKIVGMTLTAGIITGTVLVGEVGSEEKKGEYMIAPHKNLLIYDSENCKWDYIDPDGKLHAVRAIDGDFWYVDKGERNKVDFDGADIETKK